MSSHANVFACFDDDWPGLAERGFEGTDGWVRLGEVPGGAGVERPFWDAVNLQERGGGRARWKASVEFYADVLLNSPAYARLNADKASDAEPIWLGLHPFAGTARLFVPSAECRGPPGRPAAPFREAPWLAGAAELDVARLSSAAGRGRHVLQGRPALTRAIASTCHRDAITSGAGYAQIHDVTRAPVRGTLTGSADSIGNIPAVAPRGNRL